MASRDRKWIATALACFLVVGCGNGGDDDEERSGPPLPTATATPAPCPNVVTYTLVEESEEGVRSDLDFGWTGRFHDQSSGSGASLSFALTCAGDTLGRCGSCQMHGPVQSTTVVDNHRCNKAPEIRCQDDTVCPQSPDTAGCGYFFGAPLPITGGGVSMCVVNRIPGVVKGVVNPESGSGNSDLAVELAIHTSNDPEHPCPLCSGASLGASGTCSGGPRDGQSCTVEATNRAFGNTSLDCPPDPAAKAGASTVQLDLTTGTSSLPPITTCTGATFAGAQCYCPGQALPNGCGDDSACVVDDVNDNEGVCIPGPNAEQSCFIDTFRRCSSNAECPKPDDSCQFKQLECLGGADPVLGISKPIVRRGKASPTTPRLAGVFCLDATTSGSVNDAIGLPGPGTAELPTIACFKERCP